MIDILYEPFKAWSAKGSVYIISDFHFSDAESFAFRKASGILPDDVDSINALNDYVVKMVNSIVGRSDTLVCLGDVGDIEQVKKLKAGHKVLLLGNHDRGADYYKRVIEVKDGITHDNKLFDEVYSGPLMISDKILLSHEPIIPLSPCFVNLFGHVHGQPHVISLGDGVKRYNFCAEAIGYLPKSLGKMIKDGLLSNVKDVHRIAIDSAIKRSKKRASGHHNKKVAE